MLSLPKAVVFGQLYNFKAIKVKRLPFNDTLHSFFQSIPKSLKKLLWETNLDNYEDDYQSHKSRNLPSL